MWFPIVQLVVCTASMSCLMYMMHLFFKYNELQLFCYVLILYSLTGSAIMTGI